MVLYLTCEAQAQLSTSPVKYYGTQSVLLQTSYREVDTSPRSFIILPPMDFHDKTKGGNMMAWHMLAHPWPHHVLYAFLLVHWIWRRLNRVQGYKHRVPFVAPYWPGNAWFPTVNSKHAGPTLSSWGHILDHLWLYIWCQSLSQCWRTVTKELYR